MQREPLYLIDGSGYIFRAYYAVRRLTTAAGFSTNAVFGFTNMLLRVLKEHKPRELAIAFDVGGKTFRHALYDGYKANRPPPPEDLPAQLPYIEQVVDAFRIRQFRIKGVEADDVIGTLARRFDDRPIRIITGDKDFMQLVDDRVHLIDELRIARATGTDDTVVDPAAVERKFGVPPPYVTDILALAGDASDNVPGVKGIGEKTAAELVKTFGHVEEILARASEIKQNARRERLLADADKARLSKELVTIKTDVDLSLDDVAQGDAAFRYDGPDVTKLRALFTELEFRRLLDDPILTAPNAPLASSIATGTATGSAAQTKTKKGAQVAQGDVGTLWLKGDSAATHYHAAYEKSKEHLRGGWIVSGDKFRQDADGYWYFEGRGDDLIKSGGIYVSPLEVENCLMQHEAVLECCVIGKKDGAGLEKPFAIVVLKESANAAEDALVQFCKARLARYKAPHGVAFSAALLPRNDRDKIDRKALRKTYS